jgi:hypothetical protein
MLGYLEKSQGIRPGDLNDLAKTVGQILASAYLLPAQRAAMYRFLATVPGLHIIRNARDVDGRRGVGVGWRFGGARSVDVFDPGTYVYLGTTTFGAGGQQGGEAVLQAAIVNHAGQLP